jgi:hypothetical protein
MKIQKVWALSLRIICKDYSSFLLLFRFLPLPKGKKVTGRGEHTPPPPKKKGLQRGLGIHPP